jgi:hypothetical protein
LAVDRAAKSVYLARRQPGFRPHLADTLPNLGQRLK